MKRHEPERATWIAMQKYVHGQPLTDREWRDLSALTMIDKTSREFGPDNVQWATSDDERRENLAFYQSLSRSTSVH